MTTRLQKAAKTYRDALAAVDKAKQQLAKAQQNVRNARPGLAEAIVAAAQSGVKQAEIVRVTGYTRERVRQICDDAARSASVEPTE